MRRRISPDTMDEPMRRRLIRLQRMEATEAAVYHRLAANRKDSDNRRILEEIAADEERHEAVLAELTGAVVSAIRWRVLMHLVLARLFGLTFAVKRMEQVESRAASQYRELGLYELAEEEDAHEARLVGMLREDRLKYIGSVVLGMSDALVELTGALAGLTFAFRDLRLIALAGLVTGIAAAFSMGASAFLSSRTEKKLESHFRAGFFTWLSYLLTVLVLVTPYLLLAPDSPVRFGQPPHVQALALTFTLGLIIVALFNFYISVVEEVSFKRRFAEMTGILAAVSLISYLIGLWLRLWLGV